MLSDILDNPKLDGVDADVYRAYVRLLAMLQRSGSRTGKITLGSRALRYMACRDRLPHALPIVARGALAKLYSMSPRDLDAAADSLQTELTVHNWAKIQGFAPVHRGEEKRREEREPETPAPDAEQGSENPENTDPVHKPGMAKASQKTACPEQLSDAQRTEVRAWADRYHPGKFWPLELAANWTRFRRWHTARETVLAEWPGVFKNWLTSPDYRVLTSPPVNADQATAGDWNRLAEDLERPAAAAL